MQISIIAIGRMQRGPEKTMMDEYLRRLPWKSTVHEIELKKQSNNAAERKAQEAAKLLSAVPDGAMVVALDERGKALSSRQFSGRLSGWIDDGIAHIAFIIGGADGLDQTVRDRANLSVAFGTLTWPHMLARAMLSEQIYRAWSIATGHPYHRD